MNDSKHLPILIPERVLFIKKTESKKCVFDSLTALLEKGQSEVSKNEIFDALTAREKLGNTYIGNGIALPRAHLDIAHPKAALLVLKKGINLNSADKQAIQLFLGVLIPSDEQDEYSVILSEFNKKILLETDLQSIIKSGNPELAANHFDSLLSFHIEEQNNKL